MFNMKVIFFVSCLIVAAIADDTAVEITGPKQLEDVTLLQAELARLAPGFTFGVIRKITEQKVKDGIVYTFQGTFKNEDGVKKECTLVLTADKEYHLDVKCDGETAKHKI